MKELETQEWVALTIALIIVLAFFVFSGIFQNTLPGGEIDVTQFEEEVQESEPATGAEVEVNTDANPLIDEG